MPYYVYILVNPEGKTYIGQTNELGHRFTQHNDPNCQRTLHTKRHRGPWNLLHSEEFTTHADAMRHERELKTGKGRDWIKRELLGGC